MVGVTRDHGNYIWTAKLAHLMFSLQPYTPAQCSHVDKCVGGLSGLEFDLVRQLRIWLEVLTFKVQGAGWYLTVLFCGSSRSTSVVFCTALFHMDSI